MCKHEDSESVFLFGLSLSPLTTHSLNYHNVSLLRHPSTAVPFDLTSHIFSWSFPSNLAWHRPVWNWLNVVFQLRHRPGTKPAVAVSVQRLQNLVCRWGLKLRMVNSESVESKRNCFSQLWRKCLFSTMFWCISHCELTLFMGTETLDHCCTQPMVPWPSCDILRALVHRENISYFVACVHELG